MRESWTLLGALPRGEVHILGYHEGSRASAEDVLAAAKVRRFKERAGEAICEIFSHQDTNPRPKVKKFFRKVGVREGKLDREIDDWVKKMDKVPPGTFSATSEFPH